MKLLPVVVLALLLTACGNGYESENRAIVEELPEISGVELITEEHYGYCSGDTCLFGDDRSAALLTYLVDTDHFTMTSLAEAYRDALDGWTASIEEGCLNAEPSFCDEIVFASFTRDDASINLNLDNWSVGRFEVGVDAEGG